MEVFGPGFHRFAASAAFPTARGFISSFLPFGIISCVNEHIFALNERAVCANGKTSPRHGGCENGSWLERGIKFYVHNMIIRKWNNN